jgi:hypothetical protein
MNKMTIDQQKAYAAYCAWELDSPDWKSLVEVALASTIAAGLIDSGLPEGDVERAYRRAFKD